MQGRTERLDALGELDDGAVVLDGDHFTVDEHAWSEFIERKEGLRHDGGFETHAHYAVQQTMTDDAHVYASSNLELFLHLVHALV